MITITILIIKGVVLYEHPKEDRVREPWAERGGEMAAREKGERGPKEVLVFLTALNSIDHFPWGYGRITNNQSINSTRKSTVENVYNNNNNNNNNNTYN